MAGNLMTFTTRDEIWKSQDPRIFAFPHPTIEDNHPRFKKQV